MKFRLDFRFVARGDDEDALHAFALALGQAAAGAADRISQRGSSQIEIDDVETAYRVGTDTPTSKQ